MQNKWFIKVWFVASMVWLLLPESVAQPNLPVIKLSGTKPSYTIGKHTAVLEDKTNQLSFEQVRASKARFTLSSAKNLNLGFSDATYWLKFRVKKTDSLSNSWLINQDYPLIDQVILYYKDATGNWQNKRNGDMLPLYAKTLPYRTIVFPLNGLVTNKTYTFYLKVRSSGTIQLPLYIQKIDYYHQQQVRTEMFYGIFVGILFLITITNVFLGIIFRQRVYFFYVLYITGCLLLYTSLSGHTYQYIWGNLPEINNPMLIISMGMFITGLAFFVQDFIRIKNTLIKVTLKTLALVGVLLMVIAFVVPYNKIVRWATLVASLTLLVTLTAGIYALVRKQASARYFVLAFAIYALGALMVVFRAMGLLPVSFFATHAVEIANVIEIVLIAFALSDRYRREQIQNQKAKAQAQREALYAQKQALYIQKEANENLESKVQVRTSELELKNEELLKISEELRENLETLKATQELVKYNANLVSQKNRRIQDSIKSALSIQRAILLNKEERTHILGEHYIIYRPKDVVSGDFYWIKQIGNKVMLAAVDCTGHGVPGAFMSLIGYNALEKIIVGNQNTDPAQALNELHEEIRSLFAKQKHFTSSGMDIVLIALEKQPTGDTQLVFAGAKSDVYYIEPPYRSLHRLKGDNLYIGDLNKTQKKFANQSLILRKDSLVYTGSDGLRDQNNVNRKRFGGGRLQVVLQEHAMLPLNEQKRALEEILDQYQRDTTQRDDILWMGVKL
ncbi:7TM diverse intracellular signaling domain-containing protein [uncultured Microscilla sp.]|uniref:7TM diverse intracellular signaling domain-containing protein n=1 Tax=uncultured Microscilla sp. TaxID=432653 RepID=UPI00261D4716|nr:7TM diverse intracellular signaling domain-containing protein [uncultured Microscilla sp.]